MEDAVLYESKEFSPVADTLTERITVMTWNIRFGAARIPWFGDSCGDRVILTEKEIESGLHGLAGKINEVAPDILILQEVDVDAKRSLYVDQVQWLLDHTNLNYGAYASIWQTQYIPSDGLGRMDMGNAILSRWPLAEAERIQLPLRGDQDALTQYFYLQRNILKAKVAVPGWENYDFYTVGIHAAAFSTDDTKKQHIDLFEEVLDEIDDAGGFFVAGGDLNELPPFADSTNFCDEDRCPGESADSCRGGSDLSGETEWLFDLYDGSYMPAVPLPDLKAEEGPYFTHSVAGISDDWNRKLDYLFTNSEWWVGPTITHQDAFDLSDHAAVSGKMIRFFNVVIPGQ